MINSAFTEWADNPVMTTLDTIAAPINNIQFPTVTVCADTKEPPDNWAFLENLLDFLDFNCRSSLGSCNDTETLQKKFEFLMKNVFELFAKYEDNYGQKITDRQKLKQKLISTAEYHGLGTLIRNYAHLGSSHSFSLNDHIIDTVPLYQDYWTGE